MTENEAKAFLKIEKQCINRNCDRNCAKCDIVQKIEDLNSAYDTAINALEEVQQYRKIGTVEECRAAVEKQIPKKPKHTYIKHGKHTWKKDKNGEIDNFAWGFDYHNGVVCEVCGKTVCVHCNPDYNELDDCEVNTYSCPVCDKEVDYRQKYCDCGQKLDWRNKA